MLPCTRTTKSAVNQADFPSIPEADCIASINNSADKSSESFEKSVKLADNKFTQSAENLTPSADKAAKNCEDGDYLPTPPSFSTFRWRRRSTASHIIFKTRLLICRRFR